MEVHYGNCLIEALKAKIKYRKQIKIICIPPWKNEVMCWHLMWHDFRDNNIYDFHSDEELRFHQKIWFKGYIMVRPYEVYERWKRTRSWREQ